MPRRSGQPRCFMLTVYAVRAGIQSLEKSNCTTTGPLLTGIMSADPSPIPGRKGGALNYGVISHTTPQPTPLSQFAKPPEAVVP